MSSEKAKPDSTTTPAKPAPTDAESKALLAQSWVQKLKRFNEGKTHKTAAENDREADIEFLKLLEEEKNLDE